MRKFEGMCQDSISKSKFSSEPSDFWEEIAEILSHGWNRFMWNPSLKVMYLSIKTFRSDQIRSVAQSCSTVCDPMNCSMPGLPVHHQLPEFIQTHVHRVTDAIQPPHPLSSPSPLAPNPSQHQSLFQWVNSSHEVAKVLEFQLQHQSFQWTPERVSS